VLLRTLASWGDKCEKTVLIFYNACRSNLILDTEFCHFLQCMWERGDQMGPWCRRMRKRIRTNIRICTHTQEYIHICTWQYKHMHTHQHAHTHISAPTISGVIRRNGALMPTNIYMYTFEYIHIHTHTRTYTYMHNKHTYANTKTFKLAPTILGMTKRNGALMPTNTNMYTCEHIHVYTHKNLHTYMTI